MRGTILETLMNELFEPFFRGKARASKQGLGIGTLHRLSDVQENTLGAMLIASGIGFALAPQAAPRAGAIVLLWLRDMIACAPSERCGDVIMTDDSPLVPYA